jgi:hypothetical protein
VNDCTGSFALEVFLKREPTADEIETMATTITTEHGNPAARPLELPGGLGTLYWNTQEPTRVTLDDHGEPHTPRLGMAGFVVRGETRRHIFVRWPFTDERAQAFLDSESKQLPKDSPGLIMIQASNAVGSMKAWRSLIERRFQPSIYTRVSAVCLFSSGQVPTPEGEAWQPETQLIVNPHARFPLPSWIVQQLRRFQPSEVRP